jgi:hypothetical protein
VGFAAGFVGSWLGGKSGERLIRAAVLLVVLAVVTKLAIDLAG